MSTRPTVKATACPLDCPDLCELEVTVDNGRIVKISGRLDDPITQGFICRKVRHFDQHVYGAERILSPARRVGPKGAGALQPIGWDEALDEIVRRFQNARQQFGAESILPFCYGGSNGKWTQDGLDARLFRRLGASRLARTVCAAPTGRVAKEMYGKMHGVSYEDYAHSQLIVLWGVNPQATGIHLIPFLRTARERGAVLVVVDPRRTALARQADLHLAVRPGSDVAVALSIIHWLFQHNKADLKFLTEHTTGYEQLRLRAAEWSITGAAEVAGIEGKQIEHLAELLSERSPAVVRCGWGIERNRNAGSSVAAVLALPAVAGKFGVRGGGYTMSNSGTWQWDEQAIHARQPRTRVINMNQLGRALLYENNPPIAALFVYNANPLATIPNQQSVRTGLERADLFTVVFDQVMTDTARYADIVLPATTFLEHYDYRAGYGRSQLRKIAPVIEPIGQARSNADVFGELIQRMGLNESGDVNDHQQWMQQLLAFHPEQQRALQQSEASASIASPCGPRPIQFVDVYPGTSDHRIHLFPVTLDSEAPEGLYQYLPPRHASEFPLQLISPATAETINSTMGQLQQGIARLAMHPADAAERQLSDGDSVRVYNELGQVECRLHITDEMRPGIVALPKGLWSRHTFNGQTANALCSDELTDVAGGACFNDARVQVVRRPAAEA